MTVGLLLMAEGPSSPSISVSFLCILPFVLEIKNNIVNPQSQDYSRASALRRIDFRATEWERKKAIVLLLRGISG